LEKLHFNNWEFSPSNPVLIRQFKKKLQSDPILMLPKLPSVLIQSWSLPKMRGLSHFAIQIQSWFLKPSPSPTIAEEKILMESPNPNEDQKLNKIQ